ncbi:MAG: hypothetical protein U0L73_02595 [Ruminococcus bromii]|nr:hypothetical protein [Ruminococcus bromii]
MEVINWDEKEVMSKEYAVSTIEYIMQFCKRLYYQPQIKPFNSEEGFAATLQELNGLKEFILLKCGE